MKSLAIAVVALSMATTCSCSPTKDTVSPNGKISVSVYTEHSPNKKQGQAYFSINYLEGKSKKQIFSKAGLGLCTEQQRFADNLRLVSVSPPKAVSENYKMITGKRSHCTNKGIERVYQFENENKQTLKIAFRAFNDGVVFRSLLEDVETTTAFVTTELTSYPIPDGATR